MKNQFDYTLRDTQATAVSPVAPEDFDAQRYADYELSLLERCRSFWQSKSGGVLVYRRMRVGEVFAEDAADMKKSLAWQLGALEASMKFKADVPNFLEPWYGIGTAAAAFGLGYVWEKNQAPALNGKFATTEQALHCDTVPTADTPIGRHTLHMVEYFLEATKGLLPVSYCDVQSPLNVAGNMVDTNNFLTDFYLAPENVAALLDKISDIVIDFTQAQQRLIGDQLASPGHGFASSRAFAGFGMSDDNAVMISAEHYVQLAAPSLLKVGNAFGGAVFHSCGNWSGKCGHIAQLPNLRMADGAFTHSTDPSPNDTAPFPAAFANSGVVLNARMVGDVATIEQKVRELWRPGMKLIVVTYCATPEEQERAYEAIHGIVNSE
ncbi:MAG: uroporphyrinogen decarboxylase family protein [Prevotellaceae bacterium]|jgi:hypothetical protein|nr:uroporphyrinogen decarboxylase family protein [Prevotellaceae bacterium]